MSPRAEFDSCGDSNCGLCSVCTDDMLHRAAQRTAAEFARRQAAESLPDDGADPQREARVAQEARQHRAAILATELRAGAAQMRRLVRDLNGQIEIEEIRELEAARSSLDSVLDRVQG